MIDIKIVIVLLLFLHFIGDFVLQSHEMACNKAKSIKWLSYHVLVYSLCFLPFGIRFFLFMFTTHYVIDYFTSRMTSKLWKEERIHDFFVVIGFDQFLHMVCLMLAMQRFLIMEAV